MSSHYLSHHEISAIKAIDIREVERRVGQALDEGRPSALYELQLSGSGSYIASRLDRYERDLANYGKTKAATKRSETRSHAWSSGNDLVEAVRDMKGRVEEQEEETQLLRIDDQISRPDRFGDRVQVRVGYQWRASVDAAWAFGSITFFHNVDMRPDYAWPQPARKPSAAKVEEQRQETLAGHWDHLRLLALHSVREFLKAGGDGSTIPNEFEAKPGRADRYLNNFSCDFWGKPDATRKVVRAEPVVAQLDGPSDEISSDGRLTLHCRVMHAKFGEGVVIKIAADTVTADFGENGSKSVMASFLTPLTE